MSNFNEPETPQWPSREVGEPPGRPIEVYSPRPPAPRRRRLLLPMVLFIATCVSTYGRGGAAYAVAVMTILLAHEMGHFLQTLRYRVPASLPFFIPMPISPFGTMGAVIVMHPGMGNRRALFDIGITGPIAGLIPAILFSLTGLSMSTIVDAQQPGTQTLGEPLLFKLFEHLTFGPLPAGKEVLLHPIAFAGWVGLFITGLNLIPIGQLDGGHILYALLRRKARPVATALLVAASIAVVLLGYHGWLIMILLLIMVGPSHPPTDDDSIPLGSVRTVLGWLALLFVVVGFTPTPFGLPG